MPSAKDEFLSRILSFEQSLSSDAVKNKILLAENKTHNEIARMLRNGLAVVGFAALEDFIKNRSAEIVSQIGQSGVPFYNLPEKLQNAATYEAIKALNFQINHRGRSEKIPYIQEHAEKIASTRHSVYDLSEHIFGYEQSNVTAETINRILISFNIHQPWQQMKMLASRLSLTGLPLEETFRSAAKRRHRAAHVASADTPESELRQYIQEAYAVCISFDLLLTKALKQIQAMDNDYLTGQVKIQATQISLRHVKYIDRRWKEYTENANRAIKVSNEKEDAISAARVRANSVNDVLIEYNEDTKISNWYF